MQWWYRFLRKVGSIYYYAYSCESKAYDGIISFSVDTQTARIEKPSVIDQDSEWMLDRSLRHFYQAIEKGITDEMHICCG